MKESLRILQISIEVNSGSVGRIAEQIGEKVIEKGWESYITFARNNLPSKSNLIKIGTMYDVYLHGILTRITDKHAFYSTRATKELIKQIDVINPDIIHLHHLHGYFINVELLFNYLEKINLPVVWTFHDCWSFTGHCAYFDYIGCDKWVKGCYSCEQKREYPASLFRDRSEKNYLQKKKLFNSLKNMTIVPVSFWLSDLVKKSFLKNYPVQVIQNGIDLKIFRPSENTDEIKNKYNLQNKFVIIGVASTWEKRKGLDDFIKLNEFLKDDEKIIIVGVSKQQIKNLPPNFIGIQRTENVQELADLYSMADVFVNPTYEDTFPTTNLEALACGTPVITYRTGGSVESVDKKTGIIVEKGDFMGLLEAISTIKKNTKSIYTNSCRNRALLNYNKHDRFEDYMDLYSNLIKKVDRNT